MREVSEVPANPPHHETPSAWRAAVLRHVREPLDIVRVRRPQLHWGQVTVKLHYSGVCKSQVMEVRGLRGDDRWLPHLLGHEGSGVVVDVGPGVTKVAPGDEVIVGWVRGQGIDSKPPVFRTEEGELINAGRCTTFSEYTIVAESRVYLKPPEIDHRWAVLFGCAFLTGPGMVLNEAKPVAGESILINGLGGVGLAALVSCAGLNVRVIAADPDAEKRRIAKHLGANFVVNPLDRPLSKEVRDNFPEGVDVAIDSSGTTEGIEAAFAMLRYEGGRLIFASHPPAGEQICIDPHDLIRGRIIRGSWAGGCRPDTHITQIANSILASKVDIDVMIRQLYPLDEVNGALDDLAEGRALRPLIDFSDRRYDT